jgi:hypothetical protein
MCGAMLSALSAHAQVADVPEGKNSELMTTVYVSALDAGGDAFEFSNRRNAIGVVVLCDHESDAVDFGDAFANELISRGIDAKSFASKKNNEGCAVAYKVGYAGIGPMSVNAAAAQMSEAIELSRLRDRTFSPQ